MFIIPSVSENTRFLLPLRTPLFAAPIKICLLYTSNYMKRIACPDLLAMGHGVFEFSKYRSELDHLLDELEEFLRIYKEHII